MLRSNAIADRPAPMGALPFIYSFDLNEEGAGPTGTFYHTPTELCEINRIAVVAKSNAQIKVTVKRGDTSLGLFSPDFIPAFWAATEYQDLSPQDITNKNFRFTIDLPTAIVMDVDWYDKIEVGCNVGAFVMLSGWRVTKALLVPRGVAPPP